MRFPDALAPSRPGGRRFGGRPFGGRAPARVAGIASVVALVAGCGVQTLSFATPPDTPPSSTTSTTLPPDLTGVSQRGVSGDTTTTQVAIGPGQASLNGTVLGPHGPVAGATVSAERIVGSSEATVEVTTGPDGGWTIPRILGGRYRVRAWQAPTLDLTTPQIFFLGGNQAMPVNLQLTAYTGQQASSAVDPTAAYVGNAINVVVSVANQAVDPQGIVTYQPAGGVTVQLSADAGVAISADPQTTGSDGEALFQLTCVTPGSVGLSATTNAGATTPVNGLTCDSPFVPPVTSPTTTPSSSSSSSSLPGPPSSTTTSRSVGFP